LTFVISAFCLSTVTQAAEKRKFTLVIDAGHGGKDAGALGRYSKEKNINLSVALAFGRYVEQNCPDVKVIYTRKTDVFIPLHERANIANKNKADVFISVHTNAVAGSRAVTGMETYTMGLRRSNEKLSAAMRENEVVLIENDYQQHYDGFDPRVPESYIIFDMMNEENMVKSVQLAKLIQQKTCAAAGRPNKGVKQDAFLVLRETSMPACLIELGYITTASEERILNDATKVDAIARGIYQAFVEYKRSQTGGTVQPPTQTTTPPAPATPPAQTTTPPAQSPQPVQTTQPEQATQPVQTAPPTNPATGENAQQTTTAVQPAADDPVFKVQFMACAAKLQAGDSQFKGLTGVDSYKEGSVWKYTVGSSADYNEIYRLRKSILNKFPEAFIIAFKNGERVDAAAAYREYKRKHNIR